MIEPVSAPRWVIDPEREGDGTLRGALSVFLIGARCPFSCVHCDLGESMLDGSTPAGAIPRQIELALAAVSEPVSTIKLYNAANFFDRRAVPEADLPAIAALLDDFDRVVVECHPRLLDARIERFASRLRGSLEVAMGLETVNPQALPRLRKAMTLADYERAAQSLRASDCSHRAFVLIGTPFALPEQAVQWAIESTRYAAQRGARLISLIPLRTRGIASVRAPTLAEVEQAMAGALRVADSAVVQIDPWDLDALADCERCFAARRERLIETNLSGVLPPPIQCDCGQPA